MFFFKNCPSVISISRVRHTSNHQEGRKILPKEGKYFQAPRREKINPTWRKIVPITKKGGRYFQRKEILPSTKKGGKFQSKKGGKLRIFN